MRRRLNKFFGILVLIFGEQYSDTDYDRRVRLDMWYVLNWSLWLDLVILIKTVKAVLKGKGAY